MSKGHMEALAALKALRAKSVTKPARVTKPVTPSVTPEGGRPRVHKSTADKQKAYRHRKKAKA